MTSTLLDTLRLLEVELHRPAARRSAARLSQLLHEDFREIGRSGTVFSKADILVRLPAEAQPADVVSDCFELRELGADLALLTYRSAHRQADGSLHRFTWRSSLWQRGEQGWQMSFHQGTPTDPFECPTFRRPA